MELKKCHIILTERIQKLLKEFKGDWKQNYNVKAGPTCYKEISMSNWETYISLYLMVLRVYNALQVLFHNPRYRGLVS